jgi:hypothetical protein
VVTRIACIIIAHERRVGLVNDVILDNVLAQDFDDVIVVGDWLNSAGDGWRYLHVPALTRTTRDALVKRDVGTLATDADVLVYLNDDHTLCEGFGDALRAVLDEPWDVLVPNRVTMRDNTVISLNNGEREGYCGGHSGVFRREVVTSLPWTAGPNDPFWDLHMSIEQQRAGWRYCFFPRADIAVCDIEPNATPWK